MSSLASSTTLLPTSIPCTGNEVTQSLRVFSSCTLLASKDSYILCRGFGAQNIKFQLLLTQGWFPYDRRRSQTIADRRSQIADDRKESCFHIIADDRKRSQSRLQPYISVSRNVKCTRALCSRQNLSKQHSGHR